MNYFAHGRQYVGDPYFLAGTAVPDWLNVVNRRAKARGKHAATFTNDDDPRVAALARGIVQHHHDDDWFHRTRSFGRLSLRFSKRIRQWNDSDDSLRPMFLGHILVEILLDACLIETDERQLDRYYQAFEQIEHELVARAVGNITGRDMSLLKVFLPRFLHERFLYDYLEDAKLLYRLNQVMRRVGLPILEDRFLVLLPELRTMVAEKVSGLLDQQDILVAKQTN